MTVATTRVIQIGETYYRNRYWKCTHCGGVAPQKTDDEIPAELVNDVIKARCKDDDPPRR